MMFYSSYLSSEKMNMSGLWDNSKHKIPPPCLTKDVKRNCNLNDKLGQCYQYYYHLFGAASPGWVIKKNSWLHKDKRTSLGDLVMSNSQQRGHNSGSPAGGWGFTYLIIDSVNCHLESLMDVGYWGFIW